MNRTISKNQTFKVTLPNGKLDIDEHINHEYITDILCDVCECYHGFWGTLDIPDAKYEQYKARQKEIDSKIKSGDKELDRRYPLGYTYYDGMYDFGLEVVDKENDNKLYSFTSEQVKNMLVKAGHATCYKENVLAQMLNKRTVDSYQEDCIFQTFVFGETIYG